MAKVYIVSGCRLEVRELIKETDKSFIVEMRGAHNGAYPQPKRRGARWDPYIRDGAQVLEMMSRGLTVSVGREVRTSVDIAGALATMSDKPLKVSGGDQYNTHCEVHMPGQALSMYNDILLLEDVCSDALQTSLNNGWRIIAACPQADQRRPDYVLGRYNPERQSDDSNADRD